ncbi:hypothetical protein L873DRAFT_1397692 [Choiromyces venosus 120613-1]|uniref:RNI-like protein n=1 Tax=Choiromyces venosus 120613-1 TaxID=1336337 RepID=A0A3N4J942_9PEZI|nr:hypothetical protein L873DRAFT_1397692 [Choiromyces venosus 120613-1]
MWSLSSLLRKMRGSDYPYLQSLWLGPICSVEALRHLGQAISTLRLDKLCVSGILWCASRPLQLRHLVDSVEAGSHQPSYQKWNGFDLEKVVSRPGNLLGTDSLRTLELSDCSNVNGLISTLGEQSEPEKSLRALMIGNRLPSQISSMIYAIEAANEPPEDRIEIQPNHADFIIELIENSRSLESLELDLSSFSAEEATQVLESLQFSREALKYLRLNVFRNFVWLSLGTLEGHQSLDFFTPLALTRLSTFQNLRQLSICLNLRVDKISHVCRSFPPRLELLELSYVNKGYTCSFGTTVRELMLMTYTLKHRAAIAGLDFPLECIVMTELKCRARRNSLQTTIYIVHGKTGRVTAHEGLLEKMRLRRGSQTIFEFARIGLGFDGSSP